MVKPGNVFLHRQLHEPFRLQPEINGPRVGLLLLGRRTAQLSKPGQYRAVMRNSTSVLIQSSTQNEVCKRTYCDQTTQPNVVVRVSSGSDSVAGSSSPVDRISKELAADNFVLGGMFDLVKQMHFQNVVLVDGRYVFATQFTNAIQNGHRCWLRTSGAGLSGLNGTRMTTRRTIGGSL